MAHVRFLAVLGLIALPRTAPATCPAPEPPGARVSIYEDELDNCFEELINWGGHDLAHHGLVHSGSTSIEFTPHDWSILKIGRTGLRSRYKALEFWLHGGATGGQYFAVEILSGRDRVAWDVDIETLLGRPIPAGTWTKVTVPFRMSTAADDVIISLKAYDGVYEPLYIDDIALLAETAGTCTGAEGEPCLDGNVCNGTELCDGAGTCVRGVPLPVDDLNPCTIDTCDPVAGVHYEYAAAGLSCFVDGVCNAFGACDGAGHCLPSTSVHDVRVYDDAVGACFEDASTGTSYDPNQLTIVHGGAHAIRFEPRGFEEVVFRTDDLGSSFDSVEFWIHGGSVGGQAIQVLVEDGLQLLYSGWVDEVLGHAVAPGTWERVTVPLTASSMPGWHCVHFVAWDSVDELYLDDIRFVASDNDLDPPVVTIVSPPDGSSLNQYEVNLDITYSDGQSGIGSVHIMLDASDVTGLLAIGSNSATGVLPLGRGQHAIEASVTDLAGNVATRSIAFTVTVDRCDDGNPCTVDSWSGTSCRHDPVAVDDGNPCTIDTCDPNAGVTHVAAASGTSCSDGNVCNGVEVCGAGGTCLAGTPLNLDDGDACTVDSCDPLLGVLHAPVAGCLDLPADPATIAPPLSTAGITSFADATDFLYSGPDPVQRGVQPGAIDPGRAAVLRGLVVDSYSIPIVGAQVTVLRHPELGTTRTRADGRYDLVVNGGGAVTVELSKPGYLTAQRTVDARWQDFASVPDVILAAADPHVSTVLAGAPVAQVASGSLVSDSAGARTARLLFPAGTQAEMMLGDGSSVPLAAMSVRLTEYTANDVGPRGMPGELPPTSGYTYAVELGVDEAVLASAVGIQFDQPVSLYVDNFRRFPVGGTVPVGYYDRGRGGWVPSEDGRIIKVLARDLGRAVLDVNGSGAEATSEELSSLAITEQELERLASFYDAGAELWRVPVRHFSPYDLNWPTECEATPDAECEPPPEPDPDPDPDPCEQGGSIIECETQALRERVPIVGTPYALAYTSRRAAAYQVARTTRIPVTGSTVSSALTGIRVELSIAGRTFVQTFERPFIPNDSFEFVWDGRDAYGRVVNGTSTLAVAVSHNFRAVYVEPTWPPRSFGAVTRSGRRIAGAPDITRTQAWDVALSHRDESIAALSGWSLDAQHRYDIRGETVFLGDGREHRSRAVGQVISAAAGGGTSAELGILATRAFIGELFGVATSADGTVYFSDWGGWTPGGIAYVYPGVRRIDKSGVLWAVTSTSPDTCFWGADGDGKLAADVCVVYPMALAYDKGTESLFVVDDYDNRVWRMGSDGVLHHVAGGGTELGEGARATSADLSETWISGIAVGPDQSVYVIGDNRIRRVDTSGTITTLAGNGTCARSGDGGPAAQASLCTWWGDVKVGPDGSVYVSDGISVVRRIGPDGIIHTFAGNGTPGYSGDGGPATAAQLRSPFGLAIDTDGSVYIADLSNHRVRRVGPDGVITTIAGNGYSAACAGSSWNGTPARCGDGGLASEAYLVHPWTLALGPDGSLLVACDSEYRMRRIAHVQAVGREGELNVASQSGAEVHVFDLLGRHLRTLSARDGVALYSFGYDDRGLLAIVTDRDGKVTRIERDGIGNPTAIVAPYGQRTTLGVDENGLLRRITNPANEGIELTYYPGGLLHTFADPRRYVHVFAYDAMGRLTSDANAAGGVKTLSRGEGAGYYAVFVNAVLDSGRTTTKAYRVETLPNGGYRRVITDADATSTIEISVGGGTTTTSADGTVRSVIRGPDPRFGMASPITTHRTTTAPGGLTRSVDETRTVTLADPSNPLSLTALTETVAVNGRTFTTTYDAATGTITAQSPAGRTTVKVLDEKGRVAEVRAPGHATGAVLPIFFEYDNDGRLFRTSQGTRTLAVGYDAQGYPATLTDSAQRAVRFSYDLAERVVDRELLGQSHVTFGYDANGNMTSLGPPERPSHSFDFDAADRLAAYTPPVVPGVGSPSTSWTYNLTGNVSGVSLPDGNTITQAYDAAGRLEAIATGRGTTLLAYDGSGRVETMTAPDSGRVSFTYNGFLKTSETWSGVITGSIGYVYDNEFRVAAVSVNGGPIPYQYDLDGLLVQAGGLAVARDPATGRLSGTTVGNVTTNQAYNEYGALRAFASRANSTDLLSYALVHDNLGRIIGKTETVGGATSTYAYEYDDAGRLWTVTKDGAIAGIYTYDANGNRLTGPGSEIGTYDAQDRMLSFGDAAYTYGPNGDLRTKTNGGQVSSYSYDALGSLIAATLPDGRQVEYVVDALNRRIGKKVNGQLVEGFLYDGQFRPVVWLDGSGSVYARFVYGTRINVPEYMVTAAGTFRLIADHLGSPRLVVNASTGAIVQRIDYDEWGKVLADTSPGLQPFGFAGGLYDRDTGLVKFGAREYDAQTGRWTSKDPIRFAGGLNLYVYVGNAPVTMSDPTGLETVQIGFNINMTFGPIWITGSVGLAFDYNGGVGVYSTWGGGGGSGWGLDGSVGVEALSSNGDCIEDLEGPFNVVNVGGGWGPHASGAAFWGSNATGELVIGGGLTGGVGAGATSSAGQTTTSFPFKSSACVCRTR